METKDLKEVGALLRTHSWEKLKSREGFARQAIDAIAEYRRMNPREIADNRSDFYIALELVARQEGIGVALHWLAELTDSGLSGPVAAVAATHVCRATNNYDLAVAAMRRIFYQTGESPYVSYFYAQSLAAVGAFSALEFFAGEVKQRLIKENGHRSLARVAQLLTNMGLVDQGEAFTKELGDSPEKTLLSARLKTYHQSADISLPVRMVNLDDDVRKLKVATQSLRNAGISTIERQSAVSGRRLPVNIMKGLVNEPSIYDAIGAGAIGCWLSHLTLWEQVAAGKDSWVLVLEDDATPYVHGSFIESLWADIADLDVVWVNDRMSAVYHSDSPSWDPGIFPNWSQLATWPDSRQGWGTDGYLLSKNGAEKLLELFSRFGISNHIDGQMGAWTTTPTTEATNRIQRSIISSREKIGLDSSIASASLKIPLIKHTHFGVSATATFKRDR